MPVVDSSTWRTSTSRRRTTIFGPATYVNIAHGQALNLNVTGMVATAYFRGQILDNSGAPVGQFFFFANNNRGGTSMTTTDTNGFFDLPVFGGTWQFYPDSGEAQQRGLIFPPYSFQITDGIDVTHNIIARKTAGSLSGYVRDLTNAAISGLYAFPGRSLPARFRTG